ncbi:MAG: hypothetical protein U0457_00640 [Candidatus Sericytochromatia bacterium]
MSKFEYNTTKKALLLKEKNFFIINFLNTGYWVGEEVLAYYNDHGKLAKGDLLGNLILIDDCIKIILDEFFTGIYNIEYDIVNVIKTDFNRKYDTTQLKNWVGWTIKHKKYEVI